MFLFPRCFIYRVWNATLITLNNRRLQSADSGKEIFMRIGIIDILCDELPSNWGYRFYRFSLQKQSMSIMPQAIAVWCRQLGHEVHYCTFYGQKDPLHLLPDHLDVLFVASYTQVSAMAYALAKVFRQRGTLTVIGGAHARSFPTDCLRFFDLVVRDCNKDLIDDILRGHYDPPAVITSGRPLTDFPSVEERMPEIKIASFYNGRSLFTSTVPILSSVGCPYTCSFCVDWNNSYSMRSKESLWNDLNYLSQNWPQLPIFYHDPNFAVRFDETMDVIEALPEGRRNPYIMESSLSILKENRLVRLKRTNCFYVAPGIESWIDYSNKSGVGRKQGQDKLDQVSDHLKTLTGYVPGLQVNMLFGGDSDAGTDPVTLTKELISRVPEAWPAINIPCPFGGTPLYDQLYREGRILQALPFACYNNPYLTITPKHYDPLSYYSHLIDIHKTILSKNMLWQRLRTPVRPLARLLQVLRHLGHKNGAYVTLLHIKEMLTSDARFRAFHEGRSDELPEFYHHLLERRLGRYAELLSHEDRRPVLEEPVLH